MPEREALFNEPLILHPHLFRGRVSNESNFNKAQPIQPEDQEIDEEICCRDIIQDLD